MFFNLDIAIFLGFLLINLVVGIWYSRNISNLREYAIGNRNFPTAVITSTIMATWIGGHDFAMISSEVYANGLYFMLPVLGDAIAFLITGYIFIPRMAEFMGMLSLPEAMGHLYGRSVRVVAAISSIALTVGIVAMQFKVASGLMSHFFGLSSFYALLASGAIVITYSAFGGIRAVTFTDVIQFFTFGSLIPSLAFVIWGTFKDPNVVFDTISNNPAFDWNTVMDYTNPKFFPMVVMFIFFLIPGTVNPALFQRISMSKNISQARHAFGLAAVGMVTVYLLIFWIGILLLSTDYTITPDNMLGVIIDNYGFPGLKGFIVMGIMAMIMSTADSFLNSCAVIFVHDIFTPLGVKHSEKRELLNAKVFSAIMGVVAIVIASYSNRLLDLLVSINAFFLPITWPALALAILGFRSTSKTVLIGIAAGIATVILWRYVPTSLDSAMPGMLMNIFFFMGSHYLLKQPGGWVGIKDSSYLTQISAKRRTAIQGFITSIQNFNFIKFCKNNTPKSESVYSFFGLFSIISIFSAMYTIPHIQDHTDSRILTFIYQTVLVASSAFLSYPAWPNTLKNDTFIAVAWTMGVVYILVFASSLIVIESHFGQLQSMIFMLNLVIVAIMLRWQVALGAIVIGLFASAQFYMRYFEIDHISGDMGGIQFKIIYTLLLFSSILIACFKPKQEHQEIIEQKVIERTIELQNALKEKTEALAAKTEFLNNMSHEIRAPMHGFTCLSEGLVKQWSTLPDEKRVNLATKVASSAQRLSSLLGNLLDLSKFTSKNMVLDYTNIDFCVLVSSIIDECTALHMMDKKIEFVFSGPSSIFVMVDKEKMSQVLRNLLVNAIKFSSDSGVVSITVAQSELTSNDGVIEALRCEIHDTSVGIPDEELTSIFSLFTQSSRTKNKAGGTGLGLAICQQIIEAHHGKIWAENNESQGATFTFLVPRLNK